MKEYRKKEMKYLLIVYILLTLLLCTDIFDKIASKLSDNIDIGSILKCAVFSGILFIIVLLGDSLISADMKDKLIGMFIIPRAGCTIFSRIKKNAITDLRFSNLEAQNVYKNIIDKIPSQREERYKYENSKWYKIYKKHKEEPSIIQTQTDYLMCRDFNIETLEYIFFYILSVMIFEEYFTWSWKFFILMLAMLIITNIAARNKMNRFVNSVIALDLSQRKDENDI